MGLHQPQVVFPFNETIDATDTITFFCVIRGTQCVKYTIYIYDVETNTEQYSDTQSLGTTLYDGDQLDIDVDMSALGADSYYWCVDLYYDAGVDDYITSNYYPFTASSPPSIAFSPVVPALIATPSKEFICAYTQAESVGVKYFEIVLYDSTYDGSTNPEDHTIATSGEVRLNNIRYTFNGLTSGQSYQVQCTGMTQGDVAFATSLDAFDVSYVVPISLAQPTATLNDDSSVTIDWGNIVSIEGAVTGVSSYTSDFLYAGNYGLHLEVGADVSFDLDFSAPFTMHWVCAPEAGFTGDMGEIVDTAGVNYIKLGYDGTKFYININGNYYYGTPEVLSTNPYKLAIISDGITISFETEEVV